MPHAVLLSTLKLEPSVIQLEEKPPERIPWSHFMFQQTATNRKIRQEFTYCHAQHCGNTREDVVESVPTMQIWCLSSRADGLLSGLVSHFSACLTLETRIIVGTLHCVWAAISRYENPPFRIPTKILRRTPIIVNMIPSTFGKKCCLPMELLHQTVEDKWI